MAITDNFVFADPQLQAQVVNAAQVRAAADAARAQQFAETLRAMRAERQLAADREERRAIRESDIRRLDANEAERRRQFDITTGLTEKDIASRERIAGARTKEIDDRDLYSTLLKLVESDDPPTVKELEARMIGLPDAKKQILRDRRDSTFKLKKNQYDRSVAEAGRLSRLIGTKDAKGNTLTADDVLKGSGWKNVLQVNPDGTGFESMLIKPREDVVEAAPTPTFHVPIGKPPSDMGMSAEPIGDILRRRSGTPSFAFTAGEVSGNRPAGPALPTGGNAGIAYELPFSPGFDKAAGILLDDTLGRIGSGAARVRSIAGLVPQEVPAPVIPGASMLPTLQNIMRGGVGAGFYVPQFAPQVPAFGSNGVLAPDYSPFEDPLAPPVFIPPY